MTNHLNCLRYLDYLHNYLISLPLMSLLIMHVGDSKLFYLNNSILKTTHVTNLYLPQSMSPWNDPHAYDSTTFNISKQSSHFPSICIALAWPEDYVPNTYNHILKKSSPLQWIPTSLHKPNLTHSFTPNMHPLHNNMSI